MPLWSVPGVYVKLDLRLGRWEPQILILDPETQATLPDDGKGRGSGSGWGSGWGWGWGEGYGSGEGYGWGWGWGEEGVL